MSHEAYSRLSPLYQKDKNGKRIVPDSAASLFLLMTSSLNRDNWVMLNHTQLTELMGLTDSYIHRLTTMLAQLNLIEIHKRGTQTVYKVMVKLGYLERTSARRSPKDSELNSQFDATTCVDVANSRYTGLFNQEVHS